MGQYGIDYHHHDRRMMMLTRSKALGSKIFATVYFSCTILAVALMAVTPQASMAGKSLVLYAFKAEGEKLSELMDIDTTVEVLGRTAYIGILNGREIVLCESGVGLTNAAMMTQALIDSFEPDIVLFTGIAGAVDSSVKIGDIVICSTWVTHDHVYFGPDGPERDNVYAYSAHADSLGRIPDFPVDTMLFAKSNLVALSNLPLEPVGQRKPALIVGGVGVSGNSFIDNVEKRIWLHQTYTAMITDKESSAVAQVCTANGLPFLIIRSASDLAGGSERKNARAEMRRFFHIAAENSTIVLLSLLE
jgi:adenosylhomocysteine nucleosidase